MAHLYRLIALLAFVALWTGDVLAEGSYPAKPVNNCASGCYEWSPTVAGPPAPSPHVLPEWAGSRAGACQAIVARYQASCQINFPQGCPVGYNATVSGTDGPPPTGNCRVDSTFPTEVYNNPLQYRTITNQLSYTCDYGVTGTDISNGVLSGSTCNCPAGKYPTQAGTACFGAIGAACELLTGKPVYLSGPGKVGPGAAACDGGTSCAAVFTGFTVNVKNNATGQWSTAGDGTYTGATCTPGPNTDFETTNCPGGTVGEINGTTVCVPYDPNRNVIESTRSTTSTGSVTTSTPGGGTTTTTTTDATTKTTSCSGGTCTTTTTSTRVNADGTTTTEKKTESQPKDDFCRDNPRNPACKDSSFSGSCNTSFACDGDAVQCAVARATNQSYCEMTKTSPESELYGSSKTNSGIQTGNLPGNGSFGIGPGSFNSSDAIGGAACIADRTITVVGVSVTLPFTKVCPWLQTLKTILLSIAYLLAATIVFRKG